MRAVWVGGHVTISAHSHTAPRAQRRNFAASLQKRWPRPREMAIRTRDKAGGLGSPALRICQHKPVQAPGSTPVRTSRRAATGYSRHIA